MRKGATLGGFTVVTAPTNANAGMSQWAKAERDGKLYFMKRFLAPKFPTPNSPGTPDGHERRRRECESFERRQLAIINRLSDNVAGAGHLVTPKVFFRVGPSYYKVTDLVDVDAGVSLSSCTPDDAAIALRSLIASVRVVHEAGVVHSDLKPDNVLFEQTSGGRLACKLIDFDESYLSGDPPTTMRLAGDPYFYSPEMLGYVRQLDSARAEDLTTASDTFALAVLMHLFITGEPVGIDPVYTYPCEAVRDGQVPWLHPALAGSPVGEVLAEMLSAQPDGRPDLTGILNRLGRSDLRDVIVAARDHGPGDQGLAATPSAGDHPKDTVTRPGSASAAGDPPGGEPQMPARTGNNQPEGARLRSTMGRTPRRSDPGD